MKRNVSKEKFELIKEYRRFQRRHMGCPPNKRHKSRKDYKREKVNIDTED